MTLYKNYAKFENNNLNIVLTILFIMHSNQIKKQRKKRPQKKTKLLGLKDQACVLGPTKKRPSTHTGLLVFFLLLLCSRIDNTLSTLLFKNKKIKHTICHLLNRFSITEEIARKSSQGFFKPKDLFSIYFHLKYLINTLRIFINQLLTSKTLIWFQNTKLN